MEVAGKFFSILEFQFLVINALIFFVCGTINIFIMPIIFNYFIIPKIQEKIGRTLEFPACYDFELFGNFFARYTDIAVYIVVEYTAMKMHKIIKKRNKFLALSKVDYDIRTASKSEIFWSFFASINLFFGVYCYAYSFYYEKYCVKDVGKQA